MGRLAIERATPADLDAIRAIRAVAADETATREVRYRALHDLLVVLADMTRNRVWQMLGRRLRALLQQDALKAARERLRRDPVRFVSVIDTCLAALDRKRTADAVAHLQALIAMLGDVREDLAERPKSKSRSRGALP
jgi:DNA-binding FadR family transcriptional regulator